MATDYCSPRVRTRLRGCRVIWVITSLTFFGTVVVFMFALFLYFDVYAIPGPRVGLTIPEQRRHETRTAARVTLELSSLSGLSVREMTLTENVSHHGACALTRNSWIPGNMALVTFLYEEVSVRARVAYCNPSGDAFAIGLQFATAIDLWIPSTVWSAFPQY
jgi:hypothetical protein